jgi:hypothetical protein
MKKSVALAGLALAVVVLPVLGGDEPLPGALHDGFETGRPVWKQEETDVTVNLLDHDRSDRAAHDGRLSERFHFEAGPGSSIYYSYPLPKVPVVATLEVDLFARSDHAGIQLFARVVLPSDTDPDTGHASFVLIPGTIYEATDRWQRLTMNDIQAEVERRARVLRARTKRPVKLDGAYIEQLVVNLYGGPGETVVYLDDLKISPLPEGLADATVTPPPPDGVAAPKAEETKDLPPLPNRAAERIALDRNRLSKDGYDWVFAAIQAPGADLKELRRYGFDLLSVDLNDVSKTARDGVRYGFLLLPDMGKSPVGGLHDATDFVAAAAAYPLRESVAFWNLGDQLGSSNDPTFREAERDRIRAEVSAFRHAPEGFSRLTTAGVVGLFPEYSRLPHNLDVIGVHPQSWGSTQEVIDFQFYLAQRRILTAMKNPEALHWTWIPATPPEEVHQAVWGFETPPKWGIARVQPEQLRLYAYAVLAAGYRGLGFRGDADLTRASGRALLIEMALLNAEIDLFESIIAQGVDPIPLLPTFPPDPPIIITYMSPGTPGSRNNTGVRSAKAEAKKRPEVLPHASIRAAALSTKDNRGKLLIVENLAPGAQWQPPQMAINDLVIRIPGAPESALPYEVTLGTVRVLKHERVPGGMQITLPDFGATTLILISTDQELKDRLEQAVASIRSVAIALAIEQAELQIQWVSETNDRLVADGHPTKDAAELFKIAEERLRSARDARDREDYAMAWDEARRVGRSLRLVMRDHFDQAVGAFARASTPLEEEQSAPPPQRPVAVSREKKNEPPPKRFLPRTLSPVSCPPLVAFNTLPQAYLWFDWIKGAELGPNLIPSGSFDDPDLLTTEGWRSEGYPIDGLTGTISSVEGGPGKSKRALKMTVVPTKKDQIDAFVPFLDHPPAALRSPPVEVAARQLLRISVKVKMSRATPSGTGGLIVRDSLGGPPLEYRTTNAIPDWSEVVLYRRAPADGALSVTLGLAGFGEAFFDDLRIEPIVVLGTEKSSTSPPTSEERTRPPRTGQPPSPRSSPTARAPLPGRSVR